MKHWSTLICILLLALCSAENVSKAQPEAKENSILSDVRIFTFQEYIRFIDEHKASAQGELHLWEKDDTDPLPKLRAECIRDFQNPKSRLDILKQSLGGTLPTEGIIASAVKRIEKWIVTPPTLNTWKLAGTRIVGFSGAVVHVPEVEKHQFECVYWWIYDTSTQKWIGRVAITSYRENK